MVAMVVTTGIFLHSPQERPEKVPVAFAAKQLFRRDAHSFQLSAKRLHLAVSQIDKNGSDSASLLIVLKDCRRQYKKIEDFLSYFFPGVAAGVNGPPVPEGEEPFMEYQEPRGLQVIEALLTGRKQRPDYKALLQQTALLDETAASLPALLYGFEPTEATILQSIRLGVIRVITLGITGYDAPVLKTGLTESAIVCESVTEQLRLLPGTDHLVKLAKSMTGYFSLPKAFDEFDRAAFLRTSAIPFAKALEEYCRQRAISLPVAGLLQKNIVDIFSIDALHPVTVFSRDSMLISLGRTWFNDKRLSKSRLKNCASCHDPARAFSDGLVVSTGLNPRSPIKRNAPSLLYSAYQYRQFWDGRAAGLEQQIFEVLHDAREMNIDTVRLQKIWKQNPQYSERLTALFPAELRHSPSLMIGRAVGAYVNTLGRFNSAFDEYLRGDSSAVSREAKNGFNLFMGKARCGSCHFAPLFNGTLPPDYLRTEFEILGTTRSADFSRPVLSSDQGRYGAYPLPFNRYSFKTPTVRNAARTAPYMHNGRFKTLEEVLTFYNNGGGAGMGLSVPGQTLAADSLHLDRQEINDIIEFIYSLNDKTEVVKQ